MIRGITVSEGGKRRWMTVMGQYRNCWIVPQKIRLLQAVRVGVKVKYIYKSNSLAVPKEKMTYWVTIKGNRLLYRRLILRPSNHFCLLPSCPVACQRL